AARRAGRRSRSRVPERTSTCRRSRSHCRSAFRSGRAAAVPAGRRPTAPRAPTPRAHSRRSRTSRWRRRGRTRDRAAGSRSIRRLAVEAVVRLDEAHGARRRPHDDRVRHGAPLHVADTAEIVAGRDPRRRAHDGTGRELVETVLPLRLEETELPALARLVLVARLQARLHLAPDAEERRP